MSKEATRLDDKAVTEILSRLPSPPVGDGSALHAWAMQVVRELAEQPAQQEPVSCEEDHPNSRFLFKRLCGVAGIEMGKDTVPQALDKIAKLREAQRTWVGLSDEEIQTAWNNVMDGAVFTRKKVYKAIETKLKEKNT